MRFRYRLPEPSARTFGLVYSVLGSSVALMMAVCMPPLMNPDEFAHFFRADQISRGQIIGKYINQISAGGEVADGIHDINVIYRTIPFHPEVKATAKMMEAASLPRWTDGTSLHGFSNSVVYSPAFVPS